MKKSKKFALLTGAVVGATAIAAHVMKKKAEKTTYEADLIEPIEKRKMGFYEKYGKRILDIACATAAIVVFSPLYLGVAALVKLKLGSPVLFTQDRPGLIGKDGKETVFKMYKFRTMTDERDENGELLPDDVRLTKFGKWLRNTSLDELPEAFNILNGTMSVIGPRPQLVRDMTFMTKEQRARHTAKPGLSGLAQVNGRNGITWEEKLEWDRKYIQNVSFAGDVKIIVDTVKKAFIKQEGITQDDMATAEDFGDYLLRMGKVAEVEYEAKQKQAKSILNGSETLESENKKKVLVVASVVSFIEWFNKENLEYLKNNLNCEVHVACNFDYMDDTDETRTREYIAKLKKEGFILHNIHFARNPWGKDNISAYKQLKTIINKNRFMLIHCHTPTVSIMTRLAARDARKNGSVVMYTCHGFHFHNASSKKNWMIYYPVEKFCSRFCDYIITINKEDYNRAKTFHALNVRYIPGVGVDINKIKNTSVEKDIYKESIGVPSKAVMILSVGEMIERKNHEVIIRALGKIKNPNIYYVICGKGPLKDHLKKIACEVGVEDKVIFLGFRQDIPELCNTADISAFPSKIEGLGLAGIEAMAAGVPLVSSNVHGILDYVIDGETGYACDPDDVEGFAKAIDRLASDSKLRESMKTKCIEAVKPFELNNALRVMWDIYDEILR